MIVGVSDSIAKILERFKSHREAIMIDQAKVFLIALETVSNPIGNLS